MTDMIFGINHPHQISIRALARIIYIRPLMRTEMESKFRIPTCFLLEKFATGQLLKAEVSSDVNRVGSHIEFSTTPSIYRLRQFWSHFVSITPLIYRLRHSPVTTRQILPNQVPPTEPKTLPLCRVPFIMHLCKACLIKHIFVFANF